MTETPRSRKFRFTLTTLQALCGAWLLLQGGLSAQNVDPSGKNAEVFWKPGSVMPEELSADKLYPQGSRFLFSFYSVGGAHSGTFLSEEELQEVYREYTTAGFNIVGPQYSLKQRSLEDAAQHGFGVVYTVGIPKREFRASDENTLPESEIYRRVYEEVKAVADNPAIVMWDLVAEELRPWRKREMQLLEVASRAIRDADPLQRPVYHYCPGHYSAKSLGVIAPHVDILGKGMYTNYSSHKQNRVWCRWTIEEEIAAIRESGSQAVPIAVPEMFQQPEPDELALIPDWVAHDLYLSLVSGARGILVFSLRQRDNFEAWRAYYEAYQQVGDELLGELNLAQVLLFGEERKELDIEIFEGPETVDFTFPSAGIREPLVYPSIHFRELMYGDTLYLFAVNSSNDPVQAVVSGFPYDSAEAVVLRGEESHAFPIGEGEFMVSFAPLQARVWKFTRK